MTHDLTQCTATQLLSLFRSGEASPVQATQAVLQRIERLNPLLNAFCWVDEAAATASARQSEAVGKRTATVAAPSCPWMACRCPSKT